MNNKISSKLDAIADLLEKNGFTKEAYELDVIANTVEAAYEDSAPAVGEFQHPAAAPETINDPLVQSPASNFLKEAEIITAKIKKESERIYQQLFKSKPENQEQAKEYGLLAKTYKEILNILQSKTPYFTE
jgi:hypothetical protein